MRVLITGGLGYIGSHLVVELIKKGYNVLIVDNLSNSSLGVLNGIWSILSSYGEMEQPFDIADDEKMFTLIADVANKKDIVRIRAALTILPCDAVIHLSAFKSVSESFDKPIEYYQNNLVSTMNILRVMSEYDIKHMIFSSSATVYGNTNEYMTEETPCAPTSPYGYSKWMCELFCKNFCDSKKDFKIISARYMNPVGHHPSGFLSDVSETNLFPVIGKVMRAEIPFLEVYGGDYPTEDGTCIRDYVHVLDVVDAHLCMLEHLTKSTLMETDKQFEVFNVGTGKGHSVLSVVFAMEKIHGLGCVPYHIVAKRKGDVCKSVVSVEKAERVLGWKAKRNLLDMCKTKNLFKPNFSK